MPSVRLLIITGMSGAGKTVTVHSLEDLGYFCVDNLPPVLIPKFAEVLLQSGGNVAKAALVIDLRGGAFFSALTEALAWLEERQDTIHTQILFLDAEDHILVRRYKETRRRHPLAPEGTPLEGIRKERALLASIKQRAHLLLDTSGYRPQDLKQKLNTLLSPEVPNEMPVTILSFGYKHGVPIDADLLFDVRFLPNPYYEPELRDLTGLERPVYQYVIEGAKTQEFLHKLDDFLRYLIPRYRAEGKGQLVIGIGCTGGQHRSVAIAEYLAEQLRKQRYFVRVKHRDMPKQGAVIHEG